MYSWHCISEMNNMTNIRVAQSMDDDVIAQLLIKSFAHLYTEMGVEMSSERTGYLKDQAARRMFATCFVYEVVGEIVGTVTIVPPCSHSKAWLSGAWELRLLAVDPQIQGQGIARKLLKFAEQNANAAGARIICLHARRGVSNQARLYLTRGYVRDPSGDLDTHPFQEGYRKDL